MLQRRSRGPALAWWVIWPGLGQEPRGGAVTLSFRSPLTPAMHLVNPDWWTLLQAPVGGGP